jgi:NitT/TauT family transport system ATP-binding protein
MNMPDDMLTVTHLTKRFGTQTVIEDLSFAIPKGARVTIFGPSGAGKTTLINILTRVDHAYEGEFALAAKKPCTIFQEPRLFPYMTVEENIFLPAKICKTPITPGLLAQYQRWLEVCDLVPYVSHYPYQLSGGMKQKTALVRGFLMGSDFVMMDEPFKSIDVRAKQAIIRHILESCPGVTLLFVTHTVDEIPLLTESVLLFKANRLAEYTLHDSARLKANPMEVLYG